MATHSGVLAWRILGTGEPGGLLSYGITQGRTRLKQLSSSSRVTWISYVPALSLLFSREGQVPGKFW